MAQKHPIIEIQPSILIWARESIGLSVNDVAQKLGKDVQIIEQWESGINFPTLPQLEKLAYEVYKRPLAVFFMSEPPREPSLKKDFRTINSITHSPLSKELILLVRKAKHHQFSLIEAFGEKNPFDPIHKKVKIENLSKDPNVPLVVKENMGISLHIQKAFRDAEDTYSKYRDILAQNGIFTFQYPFPNDIVRGFCLYDLEYPIIVINSHDSTSAKLFSLFHELSHILLHEGDFYEDTFNGKVSPKEQFCNWFASEILVPENELFQIPAVNSLHNKNHIPEDILTPIARNFKVSPEVILRKLVDMDLCSRSFYLYMHNIWSKRYKEKQEKRKDNDGGPTYYVTHLSHIGKTYARNIIELYGAGKILNTQAADFLGVKINNISKLADLIYK